MKDEEHIVTDLLTSTSDDMEPVSAAFADERIAEKIERFTDPHQREGMESLNRTLLEREVPHNVRLHLITAVTHLSRIAEESLTDRQSRTQQ